MIIILSILFIINRRNRRKNTKINYRKFIIKRENNEIIIKLNKKQ